MRSTLLFVIWLGAIACGRAQTWESLSLPANPSTKDVESYIANVRRAFLKTPIQTSGDEKPDAIEGKRISAAGPKLKEAFGRIPPAFIDVMLIECRKIEQTSDNELSSVYGQFMLRQYRTKFTKVAIMMIADMRDIPLDQQAALFRHLGEFPELLAVVARRFPAAEVDAHISAALVETIELKSGWGDMLDPWLLYLIHLDTPNAWSAMDYLLGRSYRATREKTYWAIVKHVKAPKIDVRASMTRSWDEFAYKRDTETFARLAAHAGDLDALIFMADQIRSPKAQQAVGWFGRELVELVDLGTNDVGKVADYIHANRKNLVFDAATHTYRAGK
jgi:hypothetical protein